MNYFDFNENSSIDSLERRIFSHYSQGSPHLGLGGGVAGVLLAQTRLYQIWPTPARAERVSSLVARIVDLVSDFEAGPGLWGGIVGVLYALEYVSRVGRNLLGAFQDDVAGFILELDELLLGYLGDPKADLRYDVISGICGIGTYALMRNDEALGRTLFQASEKALLAHAQQVDDATTWLTPGRHVPSIASISQRQNGRYDLGIAHGVPGVIALLSFAMKFGFNSSATEDLLRRALRWQLRQATDRYVSSKFASTITANAANDESSVSRLGWCYGDLSVATAILSASEALHDEKLNHYWQEVVEFRVARDRSTFLLDSPGLCHGAFGVMHILKKMTSRATLPRAAALLAALSDDMSHGMAESAISPHGYGLLEGLAGVLVVAAECSIDAAPEDRPWNLCLLTPA